MALRTRLKIEVIVEAAGDRSKDDLRRWLKPFVKIISGTVQCLEIKKLESKKLPEEVVQGRAIIRGLVKEIFGPDIRAMIRGSDIYQIWLYHRKLSDALRLNNYLAYLKYYQKENRITISKAARIFGVCGYADLKLEDPQLIYKFRDAVLQQVKQRKCFTPEQRSMIRCCKGPGIDDLNRPDMQ